MLSDLSDPLLPARIQFAANVTFHILFPCITIAMGWFLLYFRTKFINTREEGWNRAYLFWTKIFALCFGLGVVSGITMSFQFGTNWPGYMKTVGNVAGPLLGYEVLTAFFLEATFLGVMLFGRNRVSERAHSTAVFLVAFGTTMSAFWILVLNSWMHTPVGFEMRDGQAFPVSWLAILFNPSMPYRLVHMLLASGLTAAFLITGVSAYRLLRGDKCDGVRKALRAAVVTAAMLVPLQIVVGDFHGINTLEHQPAKIAAIEGIWETEQGAGLRLFALPDEDQRKNHAEIVIPKLASLILTHDLNGTLRGLNEFPEHPPVKPLFFGFRIMVGIGVLMLLTSWAAVYAGRGGRALPGLLLKALVLMTFSGWVATTAGWYVTEIGRQPWLVTGVLRTADAVGTTPAAHIHFTLALYLIIYTVLLVSFMSTLFYMARKAAEESRA